MSAQEASQARAGKEPQMARSVGGWLWHVSVCVRGCVCVC